MSQDSLINNEEEEEENNNNQTQPTTTTASHSPTPKQLKSSIISSRPNNHDKHIRLVKQKKEEVENLRLQRFQEQLRKKEEKWQQQQFERVKKWLQLRNRDSDRRNQVEERRKKLEEESKAKFDEILRREKEREQRTNTQITFNLRGNASHRPETSMSLSTDILSTRRAISAPRIRSNYYDMTNRRVSNDSPISQENVDNSASIINSHQRNPIDEHRSHHRQHRSRHSHDATMTNEDSSLSGTLRSSGHNRSRPVPTSYTFWLNTGDNNNNTTANANFMRLTYAASCRSRVSRSVERCPRHHRVNDEVTNNSNSANTTINGDSSVAATQQRRVHSVTRQHLDETIRRLSKPKIIPTNQSVNVNTSASSNGMPSSQSSFQLRVSTPPIPTNSTPTTSRRINSRPPTASSSQSNSRASPSDEFISSTNRSITPSKLSLQSASKPPVSSTFTRSKPAMQRSIMTTSQSSSSISTSTTPNKQNIRRIGGTPPSKQKPKPESPTPLPPPPPTTEILESQIQTKDTEQEQEPEQEQEEEEETLPVTEKPQETESVEPINIDTVTEIINPVSKKEQQILDEQEYQRKLNQKIREAQQRLEAERKRGEEERRRLEQEEYEREQEQIRLEEEQRRVEQERLQRAIEERERENELKRQEEQRLQQQREELERKQAEETERLNRERQERAKKEEEERLERKKRLDLIMKRTRPVSPNPKPENNTEKTNGHDQEQTNVLHSNSDNNHFPTSVSTENFIESSTTETPKFKSPLIQSILNKARNSRSTDNLNQTSMTASQINNENEVDPVSPVIIRTDLSDDDEQHDSGINNTTNGHSDSPLSSSTNLNSYHEHPTETTIDFD